MNDYDRDRIDDNVSEPKPKPDHRPLGTRQASRTQTVQRIVGGDSKAAQPVDVAAFQSFIG